jgi:putative ABC transport system permease protein
MGRVTLQTLRAKKFRLLLTSLAVVLGVAFVSGTFVLTDTLGSVFDNLFVSATKGVDAVVRAREPFSVSGPGNADATRPPVPTSLVAFVRATPGVRAAQGGLLRYALVEGRNGQSLQKQAPAFGTAWYPPAGRVNEALDLVPSFRGARSTQPSGPDDVALDIRSANRGGYRIGDQVHVAFAGAPPRMFRLTGVFRFGGSDAGLAGATLAAFTPATAVQELAIPGQPSTWDQIDVRGAPGLSEIQVRDRVTSALDRAGVGGVYESITGTQSANEQSGNIKSNLSFFNTFLLIFALVALFVGAFIIYNTFSITVAQRTQELGLLRALGASGRQVMASVAAEALVVGAFSSVVGLGLGILLVSPLRGLLSAFGVSLPTGPLQIETRTIVVALLVGTGVTLISSLAPARRASRVSPISAIRDQGGAASSGRRRYWWGAGFCVLGVLALFDGLFSNGSASRAAGTIGAAAGLVFIGVAMVSPLVARPVVTLLSAPARRLHRVTGVLAEQNAIRNPRRTASTAAALMIGLALVSLIAIFGASSKASFASTIDNETRADFILSPQKFLPFSPGAAQAVRDGFAAVSKQPATVVESRNGDIQVKGGAHGLLGLSPDFQQVFDAPVDHFDRAAFAHGGVLIWKGVVGTHECGVDQRTACQAGSTLLVRFPEGGTVPLRVAGVITNRNALPNSTSYTVSLAGWEQRFPQTLDSFVVIRKPSDVSTSAATRIVTRAAQRYGGIKAENKAQFKASELAQFNQTLGLMYVLLLFAVIIALIGIVNTLALSIYERTREIGLLRAVGMTRAQLRRMIRDEAVIVSVFGSLLGLAIGIGFGDAIVQSLHDQGISLTVPVGQLLLFLILAGFAGLLAGWIPARRAARLDVLHAINAE